MTIDEKLLREKLGDDADKIISSINQEITVAKQSNAETIAKLSEIQKKKEELESKFLNVAETFKAVDGFDPQKMNFADIVEMVNEKQKAIEKTKVDKMTLQEQLEAVTGKLNTVTKSTEELTAAFGQERELRITAEKKYQLEQTKKMVSSEFEANPHTSKAVHIDIISSQISVDADGNRVWPDGSDFKTGMNKYFEKIADSKILPMKGGAGSSPSNTAPPAIEKKETDWHKAREEYRKSKVNKY
jgi:hypothetical protein